MLMKSHGNNDKGIHKPVNGNLYTSLFLQHMDPAMRPDRKMAEALTDVSREGGTERFERVGHGAGS